MRSRSVPAAVAASPGLPVDVVPIALSVDLVLLTVRDDQLCVLLVRRGIEPFRGRWALPGGFVRPQEDLAEAAVRELAEETGVRRRPAHLEQLATYGAPARDPRGRVVTVAFLALAPLSQAPVAGTDAAASRWAPVAGAGDPPGLAFDHQAILGDGLERARAKFEYSAVATAFCEPEFTVAELRRIYELVWGGRLDPRNFHRKVTGTAGFLVPTGRFTTRDGGRPAELYRRGDAGVLHPAMLRPTARPNP
ncbi:ADP-ribose pyrophosphatase [Frankia canadensis]|uniref:ADP-ribose pyrophosphatase n=1 Tax=Frankia canadensis TaxID=1836972 RepID=A0A2I2L312_9ACTN|nr:NUDIX domain-containing protein [Frankia canadensis]SNQ52267.1 ADP-ribose pyrophosphatase [Frankia canadensis]SOU59557.1 ADP-ribose pyrophosphatase [Frankia canadensis]